MKVKISEVRKQLGVTQLELAKQIGIARPYLAQIENQKRPLKAEHQSAIAKALRVNPISLVDFEAPSKADEEYILNSFRRLTPQQRREWLDLARVATGIPQN